MDFILKPQPGSLVAWYKLLKACAGLQNGALDYMVGWIRGGPEMRAFQALNFRNRCQQMALPGRQPRTSEALCRCSIDVLPWVVCATDLLKKVTSCQTLPFKLWWQDSGGLAIVSRSD